MTPPPKRGRALAICLSVVALLTGGCRDDGTSAGGSDEAIELQVMLFGGPEEVKGYNAMAAAFEDVRPGVEVEITPVATQDELMAKLTTSFAGGAPPDVFLTNFRKFGQFASQGVLQPVQPYLDRSRVLDEDDFVAAPLDAFRFDGENLTCQPQNVSSLVVYYNEDLFEDRGVPLPVEGWTWDEFLETAQQLTGEGIYGVGTTPDLIRIAPFVWSNGGELVDDPEAPTTLTIQEGRAREALDWFLDLQLVHGVAPPDVEEQSEDAAARFVRGRLGMYLDSRQIVPTLRTIEDFAWDVAPLPVAPGGTPVTMLHSDAYCIAAGTGNEDVAWTFIEFAMSREGQEIVMETGRTVPSRKDILASDAFVDPALPPGNSDVYASNAEIARATPSTASWSQVEKRADELLAQLFYGRVDREDGIRRLIAETRPLFGNPAEG